jgi:hypothetical protein
MWVIMTSVDFMRAAADLAFAQLHLADGIGGDDGGDALGAGRVSDLRGRPWPGGRTEFDLDDGADELIASADVAEALARGGAGRLGRALGGSA